MATRAVRGKRCAHRLCQWPGPESRQPGTITMVDEEDMPAIVKALLQNPNDFILVCSCDKKIRAALCEGAALGARSAANMRHTRALACGFSPIDPTA